MNNTILQNLKPCPFCGQEIKAAEIEMTPNGCDNLRVYCVCGATITFEGDEIIPSFGFTESCRCGIDAIEKWNKRKQAEWTNDEHDMPRCSNCGYMPEFNKHIDDYYYSDFCPNCGADMKGEDE